MPVIFTEHQDEAASHLVHAASPIVILPVYNSYEDVVQCIEAVVRNSSSDTAVLIVDDAGADRRAFGVLQRRGDQLKNLVVVLHQPENSGFVGACNTAFGITEGKDVVLLNSDVFVGPQWIERLAAAANSNSLIATVSSLTNHGTILSVPNRNTPTDNLPDGLSPDEAARRVARASRQIRPTIPTAVGHCVYIKRSVLDLLEGFDATFSPGYGEEVDFSQRALAHGFRHVVADDVFTFHRGSSSFGKSEAKRKLQEAHDAIIDLRYPYYAPWVARVAVDPRSPLARVIEIAGQSMLGLHLAVDAMCLGPHLMGTQRVVVETIRALASQPEVRKVTAFIGAPLSDEVRSAFEGLTKLDTRVIPDLGPRGEKFDVAYRPYQVNEPREIEWLRSLAPVVLVNQLDLIAYHDPAYFEHDREWIDYRKLAHLVASTADGLGFISEHARTEAAAEGLIRPGTPTEVVYCGVEHPSNGSIASTRPDVDHVRDGFILCLGASYLHKNRAFALRTWMRMRELGWDGQIVLAGPTPPKGSSLAMEAELLLGHDAAAEVIRLSGVTEPEKRWLYEHASLCLYPTSVEGFGLVPFEAAAHGTPTLCTRQGSLHEVLPPGLPVIERFDAEAAAALAIDIITTPELSANIVATINERGTAFTWHGTARRVLRLAQAAMSAPSNRVLAVHTEAGPALLPSQFYLAPPTAKRRLIESAVDAVRASATVHDIISPPGSNRQRRARELINEIRRRT